MKRYSQMGIADQTIARAEQLKTASELRDSLTLARVEAAKTGAQPLWDDLRDYLEQEVCKLHKNLPAAEFLRSDRFNADNFTVQTTVMSLVKLEILRCGMSVSATCTTTVRALAQPEQKSLGRFCFTVDRELQPCFTDENTILHPQQVGDRLLRPVCDFILRYPPMSQW